MLVELKLVEQRYRAVIDVLDGMSVTDVARRNKVSRQTVHTWLRRYADGGMAALADKSSKPESCPHQMSPVIEARVVEMRRAHPRWGPRSIRTHLAQEGFTPVPGRSSIYRTLVRHHLLEPTPRKRARWTTSAGSAPVRWSSGRWTSSDASISPTAPRSRSSPASTTIRAFASVPEWWPGRRPDRCAKPCSGPCAPTVCPTRSSPTTARSSRLASARGQEPVLFDRICANNGIRHILTAPYSPTTTGKVERFHKTMRSDFLVDHDRVHATIEELQIALDEWVAEYNTKRPHQSLGDRPPIERFSLAAPTGRPISRCPRCATRSRFRNGPLVSTAGSTKKDGSGSVV